MTFRRLGILGVTPVLGALAISAAACSTSGGNSTTTTTPSSNSSATSASNTPSSNATLKVGTSTTFGEILTDSAGKAVYTYGPDAGHNGQSQCTGTCLQAWPAVTVPSGTTPTAGSGVTGKLGAAMQSNGTDQVTYNGMPLYTWTGDTSPGQVTGNGVNNFSVVKASSSAGSSGSSSGGTTSTTTSRSGGYGY